MTDDAHALARGKAQAPPRATLAKDLVIKVILDEPVEADDEFELIGGSGSYKKTLKTSDAEPLTKGEKILRFKVKPDKKGYKLIHYSSKKAKQTVFLELPYKTLTEVKHETRSAKFAYAHLPSQVPTVLGDRYGKDRPVDKDLVQKSPILVDLNVEDPEL